MKWVKPKVYVIATTIMHPESFEGDIDQYLDDIGVSDWGTAAPSAGEALIEIAGRLCYRSFGTDLNLNITKVREGNQQYLQNVIVKQGHGSVLEHSSVTFIFRNVSRTLTHELVRHRVGVAISQESLRYVALDDIPMTDVEDSVKDCIGYATHIKVDYNHKEGAVGIFADFHSDLEGLVGDSEKFISKWRRRLIPPGSSMSHKKKVTSLLRRAAPIGLATSLMWTANLRTIRHVLELRTTKGAETEIRYVFNLVGELMKKMYPAIFDDFTISPEKEWIPKRSKV